MTYKIFILTVFVVFSACKAPEARRPVSVKSGSFIDQSVERNKKLNAQQYANIESIITANPERNYIASTNGFYYYYNTKSEVESMMPKFGDIVNFDYDIKDFSGNTIYTKEDLKTQNYAIDQEELFSGLREGLKLMKEGETITFLFPSQKAYGYYGDENKIGTNIPLICEVTVNKITLKDSN